MKRTTLLLAAVSIGAALLAYPRCKRDRIARPPLATAEGREFYRLTASLRRGR